MEKLARVTREDVELLDTYQIFTRVTALYPPEKAIEYLTLGLASEAGEVAGKLKKVIRKDKELDKEAFIDEIGDVLWYVARLCDELDYDLSDVAYKNINKLLDRKVRGRIQGDGDKR